MSPNPSSSEAQCDKSANGHITDIQQRSLQVKGNVSLDVKKQCLLLLQAFVSTPSKSYGANVGRRLNLVELNVWDCSRRRKGGEESSSTGGDKGKFAESVFEITVDQDMINSLGVLHGGCAAYIIDPCSTSSILIMGVVKEKILDFVGFSQSMNIIWHHPIKLGTKIRIVSTSMAVNGKIKTARCEIWNGDLLCISAIHSIANPTKGTGFTMQDLAKL